jgi:hypothetical protein
MPQNPQEVTNPGLVNAANQGDGPLLVDQAVTVSPSSNPATSTPAVSGAGGAGVATVTNPDLVDVVDQGYDGLPADVHVP